MNVTNSSSLNKERNYFPNFLKMMVSKPQNTETLFYFLLGIQYI